MKFDSPYLFDFLQTELFSSKQPFIQRIFFLNFTSISHSYTNQQLDISGGDFVSKLDRHQQVKFLLALLCTVWIPNPPNLFIPRRLPENRTFTLVFQICGNDLKFYSIKNTKIK